MKNRLYRRLMITGIACLVTLALQAQDTSSRQKEIIFPVIVQFKSMCCGVPSDSLLRCFIKSFKKKYKIKQIRAEHIGPMGREGEYWLAFPLEELNQSQAELFISKIKKVAEKMKDRGSANVEEKTNVDPSALSGRTTITKVVF